MWPDLVDSGGGNHDHDYGGRRRCGSGLVAYGSLVVVEGRCTVGLDWRSRALRRPGGQHVFEVWTFFL